MNQQQHWTAFLFVPHCCSTPKPMPMPKLRLSMQTLLCSTRTVVDIVHTPLPCISCRSIGFIHSHSHIDSQPPLLHSTLHTAHKHSLDGESTSGSCAISCSAIRVHIPISLRRPSRHTQPPFLLSLILLLIHILILILIFISPIDYFSLFTCSYVVRSHIDWHRSLISSHHRQRSATVQYSVRRVDTAINEQQQEVASSEALKCSMEVDRWMQCQVHRTVWREVERERRSRSQNQRLRSMM